jgi:predicted pyridoxine 5'-phosphate oxidase superfamily flavin-nucleotide-binding protein
VSIDLSSFQEKVNSALADGNPCLLASADPSGQPDIAFKGSMMVFDNEHLAWWERSLAEQIEQVGQNQKVTVLFRGGGMLLRFYGTAEIHKDGPVREQIMGKTVAAELDKDPDRKGYGVLLTVNRVRLAGKTLQER